MASTHYSKLAGKTKTRTSNPVDPKRGDEFYDNSANYHKRYDGTNWLGLAYTTSTSTSTSTTTTSTSTTTTSTSSSTTTTTTSTTTTSTSTTTTL